MVSSVVQDYLVIDADKYANLICADSVLSQWMQVNFLTDLCCLVDLLQRGWGTKAKLYFSLKMRFKPRGTEVSELKVVHICNECICRLFILFDQGCFSGKTSNTKGLKGGKKMVDRTVKFQKFCITTLAQKSYRKKFKIPDKLSKTFAIYMVTYCLSMYRL